MQRTRPLLIITIILAIAAFALFMWKSDKINTNTSGEFMVEDTTSVTKIVLTDKSNKSVTLDRKGLSQWHLNKNQQANIESINNILTAIANLEVKAFVENLKQEEVIKELKDNSTNIEIYQERYLIRIGAFNFFPFERKVKSFKIGQLTEDNDGFYAMIEDSDTPVILYKPRLDAFRSSPFSVHEEDWRINKVFNKNIEDIKSIKVEFFEEPNESFIVESSGNKNFTLKQLTGNRLISHYDTLELVSYLNSFKDIRYEKTYESNPSFKYELTNDSKPVHQVTLKGTDGSEQEIKTFKLPLEHPEINEFDGSQVLYDRDRMIGLINGKDMVVLQLFVFDNILVPLSSFTRQNIP